MSKNTYDAVVVGAGPNGLAAAILLQQQGLRVVVYEAADSAGGGMRTRELTLPGFHHDVCSAVHPLAIDSPFLSSLPLADIGLEFIHPEIPAVHMLDERTAVSLYASAEMTASNLGEDADAYLREVGQPARWWPALKTDILGPLHVPQHPMKLLAFGLRAIRPATATGRRFRTAEARALFAGMSAHSMLRLTEPVTAAVALVLMSAAHNRGWPVAKGGSGAIAAAMERYFVSIGGTLFCSTPVHALSDLPAARVILFDLTPRQLLNMSGLDLPASYRRQLQHYRYGPGCFKVDWALRAPIPFVNADARRAGTVHLGGSMEEVAASEAAVWEGRVAKKPFVLLSQPSLFDPSRAPAGAHTAWAYCHTPPGFSGDLTELLEEQVERFAPGFKETIIGRHAMNAVDLERYNANYVGGDINGGILDLRQLFTRPVPSWSPYRIPGNSAYICSSATPPGGGVHGMCGYHAARTALRDVFNINIPLPS